MKTEVKPQHTPTPLEEKYFIYLDKLRDSGVTNMFGAGPYLIRKFGIDREESHKVLSKWMHTFSERHAKAEGR